jgi:hypothetical protein
MRLIMLQRSSMNNLLKVASLMNEQFENLSKIDRGAMRLATKHMREVCDDSIININLGNEYSDSSWTSVLNILDNLPKLTNLSIHSRAAHAQPPRNILQLLEHQSVMGHLTRFECCGMNYIIAHDKVLPLYSTLTSLKCLSTKAIPIEYNNSDYDIHTAEHFKPFADSLTSLTVSWWRCHPSHGVWTTLTPLTNLQVLIIDVFCEMGSGFTAFLNTGALSFLTRLDMVPLSMNDSYIPESAHLCLPRLEYLRYYGRFKTTTFDKWTSLVHLEIRTWGTNYNPPPNINELVIVGCNWGDESRYGKKFMTNMPSLTNMFIDIDKSSRVYVLPEYIGSMTTLKDLKLPVSTGQGLSLLSGLSMLTSLHMYLFTGVTETELISSEWWSPLSKLKSLQKIIVDDVSDVSSCMSMTNAKLLRGMNKQQI